MLISERMASALSKQLVKEYGAAFQYTAISAYCRREALPNLALIFRKQVSEELTHAQKISDYVTRAGGVIVIPAIPQGVAAFESFTEAVMLAVEMEKGVAGDFDDLMALAVEEHDHLSHGFLQWFVDAQLKRIWAMDDLLKIVERAGDNPLRIEEDLVERRPPPLALLN